MRTIDQLEDVLEKACKAVLGVTFEEFKQLEKALEERRNMGEQVTADSMYINVIRRFQADLEKLADFEPDRELGTYTTTATKKLRQKRMATT